MNTSRLIFLLFLFSYFCFFLFIVFVFSLCILLGSVVAECYSIDIGWIDVHWTVYLLPGRIDFHFDFANLMRLLRWINEGDSSGLGCERQRHESFLVIRFCFIVYLRLFAFRHLSTSSRSGQLLFTPAHRVTFKMVHKHLTLTPRLATWQCISRKFL